MGRGKPCPYEMDKRNTTFHQVLILQVLILNRYQEDNS